MILPTSALAMWRLGCIICLFFVFALAGGVKLHANAQFVQSVEAFTGLPIHQATFVARWLPRLELMLSFALLVPPLTRWISGILCFLLVLFLVGAGRAHDKGHVDCNCFGDLALNQSQSVAWGRNTLLFFISLSVMFIDAPFTVPDQWLLLVSLPGLLIILTLYIDAIQSVRAMEGMK